mgnify:CR=1 FL=1
MEATRRAGELAELEVLGLDVSQHGETAYHLAAKRASSVDDLGASPQASRKSWSARAIRKAISWAWA